MDLSKKNLVLGEAPESDEDEELSQFTIVSKVTAQADIVAGEASESDDEVIESNLKGSTKKTAGIPQTVNNQEVHSTNQSSSVPVQYDSLLHRKLREHNYLLQTSIKDFLHHTSCRAVKSLNNSNQQLIKTQIMLQETASALKLCSNNMNMVYNKLSSSLSNTVLPNINIELPPPIPKSYS